MVGEGREAQGHQEHERHEDHRGVAGLEGAAADVAAHHGRGQGPAEHDGQGPSPGPGAQVEIDVERAPGHAEQAQPDQGEIESARARPWLVAPPANEVTALTMAAKSAGLAHGVPV